MAEAARDFSQRTKYECIPDYFITRQLEPVLRANQTVIKQQIDIQGARSVFRTPAATTALLFNRAKGLIKAGGNSQLMA